VGGGGLERVAAVGLHDPVEAEVASLALGAAAWAELSYVADRDGWSGVASCPAPGTIHTDGRDQDVTATASVAAGVVAGQATTMVPPSIVTVFSAKSVAVTMTDQTPEGESAVHVHAIAAAVSGALHTNVATTVDTPWTPSTSRNVTVTTAGPLSVSVAVPLIGPSSTVALAMFVGLHWVVLVQVLVLRCALHEHVLPDGRPLIA
jgi:hypothetical protein